MLTGQAASTPRNLQNRASPENLNRPQQRYSEHPSFNSTIHLDRALLESDARLFWRRARTAKATAGIHPVSRPRRQPRCCKPRPIWPLFHVPISFLEGHAIQIETTPFRIGRGTSAALSIDADKTLSRGHAEINWTGRVFTIRDLGSSNGTYVAGHRIQAGSDETLIYGVEIRLSQETRLRVYRGYFRTPRLFWAKLGRTLHTRSTYSEKQEDGPLRIPR